MKLSGSISDAEQTAVGKRSLEDPAWFAREILGVKLWPKQIAIARSVRDHARTSVKSCHASGKTYCAAVIALWFLLCHRRSLVLSTAPTYRQVRGILWREVARLVQSALVDLGGRLSTSKYELAEDWWGMGFTAAEYDPDRFQGFHAPHILVVVDEAAGVSEAIYEGIEAIMSGGHARQLRIGNPTRRTGAYGKGFVAGSPSTFQISCFDTPNFAQNGITLEDVRSGEWERKAAKLPFPSLITPAWVRSRWEEWGETDPRFVARCLGDFSDDDDHAAIPSSWIKAAFERWSSGPPKTKRLRLGLDVARLGSDATELTVASAWGVHEQRRLPKGDLMTTTGHLVAAKRALERDGARVEEVRVDADGLGAGLYDRAREVLGKACMIEVRSGMRARDPERYANTRAEMIWNFRGSLDPKGDAPIALPPDDVLREDLESIRWSVDSRGRIVIEPKDEIRARLGRSPDRGESAVYAVVPMGRVTKDIVVNSEALFVPNAWDV